MGTFPTELKGSSTTETRGLEGGVSSGVQSDVIYRSYWAATSWRYHGNCITNPLSACTTCSIMVFGVTVSYWEECWTLSTISTTWLLFAMLEKSTRCLRFLKMMETFSLPFQPWNHKPRNPSWHLDSHRWTFDFLST